MAGKYPPEADVIVTWFALPPPGSPGRARFDQALATFKRPVVILDMPSGKGLNGQTYSESVRSFSAKTPIREAIRRAFGADFKPLRVAVCGFSEGCGGVRAAIQHGEGPHFDAAIAMDGIHTDFTPEGDFKRGRIDPGPLAAWVVFARAAVADKRLCIISTSSVVPERCKIPKGSPPGSKCGKGEVGTTVRYVSTTETANWIWRQVSGGDADINEKPLPLSIFAHEEKPPVKIKYQCPTEITYVQGVTYRYRNLGGLSIFNYANMDKPGNGCADHIYQDYYVFPLLLKEMLAPRWNEQPPTQGICLLAGLEADEQEAAGLGWLGLGDAYDEGLGDPPNGVPPAPPLPMPDTGLCPAGTHASQVPQGDGSTTIMCSPDQPCPEGMSYDPVSNLCQPLVGQTPHPPCAHPFVLPDDPEIVKRFEMPDFGDSSPLPGSPEDGGPPAPKPAPAPPTPGTDEVVPPAPIETVTTRKEPWLTDSTAPSRVIPTLLLVVGAATLFWFLGQKAPAGRSR